MLKNTDKYGSDAHFTNNRPIKKKRNDAPNFDVMIFTSVFFIGVLILLGFAKILSPNVDVGININDESAPMYSYDDETEPSPIDERLRKLKQEDEGNVTTGEKFFSPELDEKVILPQQKQKTVGQIEAETVKREATAENKPNNIERVTESVKNGPAPKPEQAPPAKAPVGKSDEIVSAKVVVGYYATEKQAEVAKSIIKDAGLNITPIVKNYNGYYTLQVGSYSSKERAQQAASELLKSNFPARVITE